MSLSVFLVPMAISAVSVAVGTATGDKTHVSTDEQETYFTLETNMKDEDILQETLRNYGSTTEVENEEVASHIGGTEISFLKNNRGTYDAYFHENITAADANQFVEDIYNEYTRIVQQKTYEKLMERAQAEGLELETEETNEDDAIVLTFDVKE